MNELVDDGLQCLRPPLKAQVERGLKTGESRYWAKGLIRNEMKFMAERVAEGSGVIVTSKADFADKDDSKFWTESNSLTTEQLADQIGEALDEWINRAKLIHPRCFHGHQFNAHELAEEEDKRKRMQEAGDRVEKGIREGIEFGTMTMLQELQKAQLENERIYREEQKQFGPGGRSHRDEREIAEFEELQQDKIEKTKELIKAMSDVMKGRKLPDNTVRVEQLDDVLVSGHVA